MSLRLIFSGCSPPHPQHHSGSVPWTRAPSANLSGNTEESKCPAGGGWEPIFFQVQDCAGHTAGHRGHHDGQTPIPPRGVQGRRLPIPSSPRCCPLPLPVSTQTKGTEIGAHTCGSVMLLNIFKAANLGFHARFKRAAGQAWMGTGSQPQCWFASVMWQHQGRSHTLH